MSFKEKGCGNVSHIPYLFQFLNSGIWLIYGLLPTIFNVSILFTNGLGTLLSAFYLIKYYQHTEDKKAIVFFQTITTTLFLCLICFIANHIQNYFTNPINVVFYLGILGSCTSLLMFGSPLLALKKVIESKSADSLPKSMCIMGFFCSLSWTIYGGLVMKDYFIWGPNLGAFLISSFQVSLILLFSSNKKGFAPPLLLQDSL